MSDRRGPDVDSILNSYEPVVTGLTLGCGFEKPLARKASIYAEVRYDYDLDISAEYRYRYWEGWRGRQVGLLTIRSECSSILAGIILDL